MESGELITGILDGWHATPAQVNPERGSPIEFCKVVSEFKKRRKNKQIIEGMALIMESMVLEINTLRHDQEILMEKNMLLDHMLQETERKFLYAQKGRD